MSYTNVWDDTLPSGSEAANTIDDIFRGLKVDIEQRFEDIFAMPNFTADPLRPYGLKFTDAQDAIISLGDNAGTPRNLLIKDKAGSNTYYSFGSKSLALSFGNATLSTDKALNITQTWNAGTNTPVGIFLNVIDTASGAGSKLMDLQVGSQSKWAVTKEGITTQASYSIIGGTSRVRPDSILEIQGSKTVVVIVDTRTVFTYPTDLGLTLYSYDSGNTQQQIGSLFCGWVDNNTAGVGKSYIGLHPNYNGGTVVDTSIICTATKGITLFANDSNDYDTGADRTLRLLDTGRVERWKVSGITGHVTATISDAGVAHSWNAGTLTNRVYLQLINGSGTTTIATVGSANNVFNNDSVGMSVFGAVGAQEVGFGSNATITVKITAASKFQIMNGKLSILSIPTSSSGLASGDVWANSNVLTIVP